MKPAFRNVETAMVTPDLLVPSIMPRNSWVRRKTRSLVTVFLTENIDGWTRQKSPFSARPSTQPHSWRIAYWIMGAKESAL